MGRIRKLAAIALIMAASSVANGGPIFQFDEQFRLTGATGVNVLGARFDVEFYDGTCISAYAGCDSDADFKFQSADEAIAASQAIVDQIFNGGHIYDVFPNLILGCESSTDWACAVFTPYQYGRDILAYNARNFPGAGLNDLNEGGGFGRFVDFSDHPYFVLALWTVHTVPEPGTLALFGIGLTGVAVGLRKAIKRTTNSDSE